MKYESFEPFSVCFNMLKIRYRDYDEDLTRLNFLCPNDKIDVFINIESVLKYLSMIPDLENKLLLQRDHNTLMVSNFLNLIAHYKAFFIKNGLDTKIYLYHTDLDSTYFQQSNYNEDFRSYYMIKYTSNPKFVYLTDELKKSIIPEVRTIIDYVPNAYYVTSKNIEGSLIPYIIANEEKDRKNLVIGGELIDTQYSLIPNFVNHCVMRGRGICKLTSTVDQYLSSITKKPVEDIGNLIELCNDYTTYVGLLSSLGDKSRSIDGIPGVGAIKYGRMVKEAFDDMRINKSSLTPEVLSEIFRTQANDFNNELAKDFINNFYCMSITKMYDELTQAEITSIKHQITDHVDVNGLIELNKGKFFNHPLILESLTL